MLHILFALRVLVLKSVRSPLRHPAHRPQTPTVARRTAPLRLHPAEPAAQG